MTEHAIRLADGRVILLRVASSSGANVAPGHLAHIEPFRLYASLDGIERDTGLTTTLPPKWSTLEPLVLRWVELKQPW